MSGTGEFIFSQNILKQPSKKANLMAGADIQLDVKYFSESEHAAVLNACDEFLKDQAHESRFLTDSKANIYPLDRFGVQSGLSGNRVLIVEFEKTHELTKSTLYVAKICTNAEDADDCIFCKKLEEEKAAAELLKLQMPKANDLIVFPTFLSENGHKSLWAGAVYANNDYTLSDRSQLRNLEKLNDKELVWLLKRYEFDQAPDQKSTKGKSLRNAFAAIGNIHLCCLNQNPEALEFKSPFRKCKLGDEYIDYLRKITPEILRDKNSSYHRVLRNFSNKKIKGKFLPMLLADALEKCINTQAILPVGCIHGDFHGRNLIGKHDAWKAIDLGWAKIDGHVAKDYLLMEINLKCNYSSPWIGNNDIDCIANWCNLIADTPKARGLDANETIEYIKIVRDSYCSILNAFISWAEADIEKSKSKDEVTVQGRNELQRFLNKESDSELVHYEMPMFMISIGLIKYLHNGDSTHPGMLISMLTHLAQKILK